eukprot:scaffold53565_cov29-Tisochrysis_lutea.AAC.2
MALEGSCCSWLLEVGRERDTPRIRAPFPTPVRVSRSNSPPLNMANFPTPSLLDCGRGPARIPKPVRTCDVLADLALVEGVRRPFPRKGKCGMLWLDSIATVSSATPVLWSDAVPAGSITPSWCPDAKRLPRTPHIGMLPTLLSLLSESSGRGSHEVCQREATAVAPALTASPPPNRELTRPAFCDGVSGVLCLEVALPSLPHASSVQQEGRSSSSHPPLSAMAIIDPMASSIEESKSAEEGRPISVANGSGAYCAQTASDRERERELAGVPEAGQLLGQAPTRVVVPNTPPPTLGALLPGATLPLCAGRASRYRSMRASGSPPRVSSESIWDCSASCDARASQYCRSASTRSKSAASAASLRAKLRSRSRSCAEGNIFGAGPALCDRDGAAAGEGADDRRLP